MGPLLSPRLLWIFVAAVVLSGAAAESTWAEVAVVANRTADAIECELTPVGEPRRELRIVAGSTQTLPLSASGVLRFQAAGAMRSFTLSPGAAYLLVDSAGETTLRAIGLGQGLTRPAIVLPALPGGIAASGVSADRPTSGERAAAAVRQPAVVSVQLLVDDDERAARPVWEKRLRNRLAAASEILERDCGVRLVVAAVDTWTSNNELHEFPDSLAEFERVVPLRGQRLAIGFTSQYALVHGETHLGGIRGPLAGHLLVREWSQVINEPERLEVLLHELGHFLGEAHSPEADSVMRPRLADRRARAAKFRIGFDPLNTLAASTVAERLQIGDCGSLSELSLPTRLHLRPIYAELAGAMPDDPNPKRYVTLVDRSLEPIVQAARTELWTVVGAAARTPAADHAGSPLEQAAQLPLAERWSIFAQVNQALPPREQAVADVLTLGLSGQARDILSLHPLARPLCRPVLAASSQPETPAPHELPGHHAAGNRAAGRIENVVAGAALADLVGPPWAEAAALADCGLADPTNRAIDLATYADRLTGIALARQLSAAPPSRGSHQLLSRQRLSLLVQQPLDQLLLPLDFVADGAGSSPSGDNDPSPSTIGAEDFSRRFGSIFDERFLSYRRRLFAAAVERCGDRPPLPSAARPID